MATSAQINMENSSALPTNCAVCKSENHLKRCSRCKIIFYCSRDHQRADWIRHKAECEIINTRAKPRPTYYNTDSEERTERGESTENTSDSTQAEIDSILDFSTVMAPTNPKPQNEKEEKEIFFDLVKSESNYAGPSADTEASYNNIIGTLCIDGLDSNISQQEENLSPESNSAQNENGPLFDTHPFRRLKFPKPESYNLSDVSEFVTLRLTQLGYCILDNALSEDLIDGMIDEVKDFHNRNEFCKGDTLQTCNGPGYRNDMVKWVDKNAGDTKHISEALAYINSLIELLQPQLKKYCHIEGHTEAMMSCYTGDGSYFRRHIDNESKDGRCITCTLYLNRDWNIERDGGLMRMFPPKQDKPVDVPPLANRLLFFWSDARTPHEIHPSHRDRYSITVWYFDKDEKEAAKVEKLKRETEEINDRITALEEQRRRLQEMTSSQQIRNRAMEAVQGLTPGELQALSLLIDHHPDPKQALTAMGISEPIQDALIVHLNSQDSQSG